MAEAGTAGYEAGLWISLVAPAATPPAIIARLNREVNDVLKSAETRDALVAQGLEAEPGPPEAVPSASAATPRNGAAWWRRRGSRRSSAVVGWVERALLQGARYPSSASLPQSR